MTRPRAVFDASVVVRALVDREETAADWLRRSESGQLEVTVPDLLYAECANAVAGYVRRRALSRAGALAALELIRRLRLGTRSLSTLMGPALALGLERGVSVYDGCYLALAEAERAVLVTADRRLAAATASAELLP